MRRLSLLVIVLAIASLAVRQRAVRPPYVPPAYRSLYQYLDANLTGLEEYLETRTVPAEHRLLFGAELLPANGNRGADLLTAEALAGVGVYLDALQRLGVNLANVSIGYPQLDPSFPRSAEHVAFYRAVAQQVRQRGMKLSVEVGVVFAGTAFANYDIDFSTLTLAQYRDGKRVMAQTIVREMAPDYLGLVGEPDTEAALTGLEQLNNPETYRDLISHVLQGLDRGETLIGAGIGTWGDLRFVNEFVKTSIDFVDVHLYPVWPTALQNVVFIADIARRHGKRVTLDETWLYKAHISESTSIAANEEIFRRDAFGFWTTLDRKFLRAVVKLTRAERYDYISPFWSVYFFGSVDYDAETAGLSYVEVARRANARAVENILAGRVTPLGEEYARLIADNR